MTDSLRPSFPDTLHQAKVLVTGGQGFIGRHLVERLRADQAEVWVAARTVVPRDRALAVDLTDRPAVRALFGAHAFDVVFHCAGTIDQGVKPGLYQRQMQLHFDATLHLVEEGSGRMKRLIHLGSNAEYGSAPCPQDPAGPAQPNSAYGVSKLAATCLVVAKAGSEGLPATVVRPFLVYGAGQAAGGFLAQAIRAARAGGEFPTSPGGQTRDFVPVDAVVEDLIRVSMDRRLEGRVVNSCTGVERSVRSVLELLRELAPTFAPRYGALPYRETELMRSVGVPLQAWDEASATVALRTFLRKALTA